MSLLAKSLTPLQVSFGSSHDEEPWMVFRTLVEHTNFFR
jgi:hypothetical protein